MKSGNGQEMGSASPGKIVPQRWGNAVFLACNQGSDDVGGFRGLGTGHQEEIKSVPPIFNVSPNPVKQGGQNSRLVFGQQFNTGGPHRSAHALATKIAHVIKGTGIAKVPRLFQSALEFHPATEPGFPGHLPFQCEKDRALDDHERTGVAFTQGRL